jgi:O-antigen ligase
MFNYIFTFIFISTPVVIGSKFPIVSMVGKFGIYIYSILLIVMFLLNNNNDNKVKIDFTLGAIFFFIAYMVLRSENFQGLMMAMQFGLVASIFVFYRERDLPFFQYSPSLFVFILLGVSLLEIFIPGGFFANRNYWSIMILLYFFPYIFVCNNNLIKTVLISLAILLVVISGSRSVLLSIVISYVLVYHFLSKELGIGKLFKSLIILLLVISLLLFGQDLVNSISSFDGYLLEHTGKRFESGRFDIWMALLNSLTPSEWLIGKGGGISAGSISDSKLSAHSTYIYILFTYGLVGLFSFFTIIFVCIRKLLYMKMFMSVFFVVCLLIRDAFEVSIINNSFSISVFFWGLYMTSSFERAIRKI